MQYLRFDPAPFGFPKPQVPVLPAPSLGSFSAFQQSAAAALLDAPGVRLFTRGRYALAQAFRRCGVGPLCTVLAPAYHCRSMLDPAIRLGADVVLYPVQADLGIDLGALAARVEQCSRPIKAILVTHFFGFPQPMQDLIAWCKQRQITVIEDCSHCLFLPPLAGDLGLLGSYCVSSPYKFFPVEDGGVLWTNGRAEPTADDERPAHMIDELRGLLHGLERGIAARHTVRPAHLMTAAQSSGAAMHPDSAEGPQTSTGPSPQYAASAEYRAPLAVSRWAIRHTKLDRLMARRRSNYHDWVRCVAPLSHCSALYPTLPDGCVPYMFPLLIDDPQVHFMALKRLGVPVWRWDDMAASTCGVAARYRTQLIHLPCHQELTPAQMLWMKNTLTGVLQKQPHRETA